mmetsp:Transcript_79795/g.140813  ORF Transcript_79795/g.140813 Transcript_79795/m.140813 type:complete len:86 (-) Transcript_79795:331-588(-)
MTIARQSDTTPVASLSPPLSSVTAHMVQYDGRDSETKLSGFKVEIAFAALVKNLKRAATIMAAETIVTFGKFNHFGCKVTGPTTE